MKNLYILILFICLLSFNSALAAENGSHGGIKSFPSVREVQELAAPAQSQQVYIAKYIKKHTKEQNLELFIKWRNSVLQSLENNSHYNNAFNYKYYDEEYLKSMISKFANTGLIPVYNQKLYSLSIDYKTEYDLFGKYIPDDWSLYLKDLASEQLNSSGSLYDNEKNLAMWEEFANKYPNFEEIWTVYEKINKYEKSYFLTGVFKGRKNDADIYKDEVVAAYDKFSDKYPSSKYSPICTRLSNLKKLKHGFTSPYSDKFSDIETMKNKYNVAQQFKNSVKENAKYVYDINNGVWVSYSDEYIRGNYAFLSNGQDNTYKLYNNDYTLNFSDIIPENYKFDNIFVKNGRLFIYSNDEIKLKELKYNSSNKNISFAVVNKQTLEELYKGINIVYTSNLTQNNEVKIKCKKYPKKYMIYNDKDNNYSGYKFEENKNIQFEKDFTFNVKSKTILKLTPDIKEDTETELIEYKFIFE